MKRIIMLLFAVMALFGVQAAWYWPFGEDESKPRLYRLMAPVSESIEAAVARLEDDDYPGAIDNYKKALEKIAEIRETHPELEGGAEFMSLRNKEAYVQAAIESLLMKEVIENARPISETDTTALEKRYERGRKGKVEVEDEVEDEGEKKVEDEVEGDFAVAGEGHNRPGEGQGLRAKGGKRPKTRGDWLDRIDEDIANGDFAAAKLAIDEQLQHDPEDTAYLNLLAALHVAEGDLRAAEDTLHQVIRIKPNAYPGFYNLVRVCLLKDPRDRGAAAPYNKTGRIYGGPRNTDFENELRNELKAIGYQGK